MTPETSEGYNMAIIDFKVAKHLDNHFYPGPVEIICFHCQQAAEKAVKALIVHYGTEGGMPKLHDVSFLLNQIRNKVKIEEKYYEYADVLSPYGVASRYPNELFLEEHHAVTALRYAEEILKWVEKRSGKKRKLYHQRISRKRIPQNNRIYEDHESVIVKSCGRINDFTFILPQPSSCVIV